MQPPPPKKKPIQILYLPLMYLNILKAQQKPFQWNEKNVIKLWQWEPPSTNPKSLGLFL